jgi:hypothetical protein
VRTHTVVETKLPAIPLVALAALLTCPVGLPAQLPVDQLAKPPSDAQAFTILSTSGTNGKAFLWTAGDGSRMSRDSILLRGQVWELDERVRVGSDGMPSTLVVRGVTPQGDAAESFQVGGGKATWKSPVDIGESGYTSPAFYVAQGGTWSASSELLIEALLASPDISNNAGPVNSFLERTPPSTLKSVFVRRISSARCR